MTRIYLIVGLLLVVSSTVTGVVTGLVIRGGLIDTERAVCHRLNVHRVSQDDRNAYAAWKSAVLFADALKHPAAGTPKQSAAQRVVAERFRVLQEQTVNVMTWTPATRSCKSPGNGSKPVRFVVRQPTARELALGAGQ